MRTLNVSAKCSDCCFTELHDSEAKIRLSSDGYVPKGLGVGGGDYIEITIDVDTGKVVGWKPFTNEDAAAVLEDEEDDADEH